jgi:hypothetical protein
MKTEPIQDYILKNERNLRIAAAVGDAWPEAKEKLVSGFLDRLELRLTKHLKGWTFNRWERFLVDGWPSYNFWRPLWEDQYYISLQADNYGETISFGVGRNKDEIAKRPFCPKLLNTVRRLHPSARPHGWWEARATMRSPEPDWRKPEVLWRMHKDADFLQQVADQLLEVAQASAPIIDRLARKK